MAMILPHRSVAKWLTAGKRVASGITAGFPLPLRRAMKGDLQSRGSE
jgi:hypothetical protein